MLPRRRWRGAEALIPPTRWPHSHWVASCVLLQASDHILLQHNIYGGTGGAAAGMDFKLVTTFPDAVQFRCLCAKCGIQVPFRLSPSCHVVTGPTPPAPP
jgi:hypothetical protein